MSSRQPLQRHPGPDGERYFDHLAELGVGDLHPYREGATRLLFEALDATPGQRLLELGCGTGKSLSMIGREPGLDLVGVDRSAAMLRASRRRLAWAAPASPIQLVRADARRLPFGDGGFAGVWAESVLAFQDDARVGQMLAEVVRVLRPGGRFVLNEAIWKPGVPEPLALEIHASAVQAFGLFQTGAPIRAVDGWREVFGAAGFDVLSDQRLDLLLSGPASPYGVRPPLASTLAMVCHRITRGLRTEVRAERRHYRRLEASFREYGRWIEARLFVLCKSAARG